MVLVSKKDFPDLKKAAKHLEKMGYDLTKFDQFVDESRDFYKFTPGEN